MPNAVSWTEASTSLPYCLAIADHLADRPVRQHRIKAGVVQPEHLIGAATLARGLQVHATIVAYSSIRRYKAHCQPRAGRFRVAAQRGEGWREPTTRGRATADCVVPIHRASSACVSFDAARVIIEALPGPRDLGAFLFPKNAGRRSSRDIVACWRAVREDAKLGRVRLHDLQHTAASHTVISSENLPLVGKLLRHRRHETTAGHAHLADSHLVDAAEKVGKVIARAAKL